MKTSMKLISLACASTLMAGGLTAGAFAGNDDVNQRSVTINFAHSDLTNPAGVAEVRSQIASAARAACSTNNNRSLHELQQRRACMKEAIDRAELELDSKISRAGGTLRLAAATSD